MAKIVQPNEWDIEFAYRPLPGRRWLVTCTLCSRVWTAGGIIERLEIVKRHRAEHFGEKSLPLTP